MFNLDSLSVPNSTLVFVCLFVQWTQHFHGAAYSFSFAYTSLVHSSFQLTSKKRVECIFETLEKVDCLPCLQKGLGRSNGFFCVLHGQHLLLSCHDGSKIHWKAENSMLSSTILLLLSLCVNMGVKLTRLCTKWTLAQLAAAFIWKDPPKAITHQHVFSAFILLY